LSADTQKYEIKDSSITSTVSASAAALSKDIHETIRQQRKLLNSRLGIDVGGAANLDTTSIFSDEDLLASSTLVMPHDEDSAQQMMNQKRKMRVDDSEKGDDSNSVPETPDIKKLKDDDEQSGIEEEIEKPSIALGQFSQWLISRLFMAEWESRHGAATALRELVKQISLALKQFSKQQEYLSSKRWFENCLTKLLSVIALDRFADYVGDEAVAPVRETCAQIIGIISLHLDDNCIGGESQLEAKYSVYVKEFSNLCKLCHVLNEYIETAETSSSEGWELRHSGIMALKYCVAANIVSSNRMHLITNTCFTNILKCVSDDDDDVRYVASACLEPVALQLSKLLMPAQFEQLAAVLVDVLSKVDELGTACSNIMSLLSDLLAQATEVGGDLLRLLSGGNQTGQAVQVVSLFMPYLQHNSLQVRMRTLVTLEKLIVAINRQNETPSGSASAQNSSSSHSNSKSNSSKRSHGFEANESIESIILLMRGLYQQAILMSNERECLELSPLLERLWRTLCTELSEHCLINVCFSYIASWLLLFMHPSSQPIESSHLTGLTLQQQQQYIGSNQTKFEEKQTRDNIIIKCRICAARMLACLLERIYAIDELDTRSNEKPIVLMMNYIRTQISFKSGVQRMCYALLMIEWATQRSNKVSTQYEHSRISNDEQELKLNTYKQLQIKIVQCLSDENMIYFDEIASAFTRLQKECRYLISSLRSSMASFALSSASQNPDVLQEIQRCINEYAAMSVYTFENVNALVSLIDERILSLGDGRVSGGLISISKKLAEDTQTLVCSLRELVESSSNEQDTLQIRSSASMACACVAGGSLCDKMNPMIRPLMESIRRELNIDLQTLSSLYLAHLLVHACARQPNPVPKIFKNLLSYLCNDVTRTPLIEKMPESPFAVPDKDYYEVNRYYGIISELQLSHPPHLHQHLQSQTQSQSQSQSHEQQSHQSNNGEPPATPKTKRRTSSMASVDADAAAAMATAAALQASESKLKVEKRGAELTIKSVCNVYNERIESVMPELLQTPLSYLDQIEKLLEEVHSVTLNRLNINIGSTSSNPIGAAENQDATLVESLMQSVRNKIECNLNKYQELISYLQLIEYLCQCGTLAEPLLDKLVAKVSSILKLIKCPLSAVRHMSARALASLTCRRITECMDLMLVYLLDSMNNSEFDLFGRQGALELVQCLFDRLGHHIIPYTVIFIVPVLKRMCDLDWYVRSVASHCFATLVKLYPLDDRSAQSELKRERHIDNESGSRETELEHDDSFKPCVGLTDFTKSESILRIKEEQQEFLDQLMDNRKLHAYELPDSVLLDVKLRPYQQMGVNWLAFLKKFNLHGILCDDMGLGKTLQSICILAGDHFEKALKYEQALASDTGQLHMTDAFLPSLIICPTTLTNHWHHEIERFAHSRCLRPFIYAGNIGEREHLRRIFFHQNYSINSSFASNKNAVDVNNLNNNNNNNNNKSHINQKQSKHDQNINYNVFIVSYDIIRHDITHLCNQQWNYCILDEGHLIKSSKSKLSKAIKQIKASHRLILTGTPIQNNVTELWCLFDFLIPGYLGTEKQFYARYAKYISPSSSSSSSSANLQRFLERSLSQQQNPNRQHQQQQRSMSISSIGEQSESDNNSLNAFKQNSIVPVSQQSQLALESLHKQVLPFLLRRTKEEVLNDLPPKIIQDYYCEMSQLQIELYQDFAKSDAASIQVKKSLGLIKEEEVDDETEIDEEEEHDAKRPTDQGKHEHVFQALQYLRKVVNHPSLVLKPEHPRWSRVQSELKQTNMSMNDYRHSGKLMALRELLMECGIGLSSSFEIDETSEYQNSNSSLMSIVNISNNNNNSNVLNQHRVLIFCQLKAMIDIIECDLLRRMSNVSYLRLDGTVPPSERFGIVNKFNKDPSIDILLLTTQIGGLGLNLTGADTVIFVEHDWNPQKDLQAMDRAHRIGQTRVVNVYRLITKNTIEEKIMSLQKFKLGIANTVVNIENSSLSSMGTEQLMNMFNKEEENKESGAVKHTSGGKLTLNKLIENMSELWDENQYENEYNIDNFIKSLNK
jgi:TATA-binding protein-associated factor